MANDCPYIEVHHIKYLANGGFDTAKNTVVLCSSCYRALHYAMNKDTFVEDLYQRIVRLVRE
ncbi:HNH endonuclease signature motif containing protein [Chania multitudinisentens]|uniref:HNH endonuclease n=1 Tax=Chania multitudinisentens TaxID=1639108 RepID=UPI0004B16A66